MARIISVIAVVAAILLAIPAVRHWRERPPAPVPPAQPLRSTWIAPGGLDAGAGADYSFGLSIAAAVMTRDMRERPVAERRVVSRRVY